MRLKLVRLSIIVFWLIMMGMLTHKKLLSHWQPVQSFSYARIIPRDTLFRDEWMGIYYKEQKIGYSHTVIRAEETPKGEGYIIDNSLFCALPLIGKNQYINFKSNVFLDPTYRLQTFSGRLASGGYTFTVEGIRKEGDTFTIMLDTGEKVMLERKLPADTLFANMLLPFQSVDYLKPNQRIEMSTFNPLSMKAEQIQLHAIGNEVIELNGEVIETTRIIIRTENKLEATAWADEGGQIIKVELPFRLVMVQEPVLRATDLDLDAITDIDFYSEVAIPAQIVPSVDAPVHYLKVKMNGVMFDEKELQNTHQTITHDGEAVICEIEAPAIIDTQTKTIEAVNDLFPQYRGETSFIQSYHPTIIKHANRIIGQEKNALKAVRLLSEWVFSTIEQKPTISVPSAVEVLEKRSGDCNEIAILFVALARAAGIPSYPVLGLVYHKGAFFYHSWAYVYVGDWIAIDPTFNQIPADATHIQLMHGSISQYIDLAATMGKLSIEVLEYQ
ncbi:MAG: transglutaminase-like domain-containing protein [Candidatus Omnitrophica bacterium]|nr:transglutaminase-like domain-containing protein [Candidatus Omnitrophota bacterium]